MHQLTPISSLIKKPYLRKYNDNNWEFVYPESIDNEKVYQEFLKATELLDYDDYQAEELLKELIRKHPYYVDAYNHLRIAFRNQNKFFESYLTAEKSYLLAKECFPKDFNVKKAELTWSNLDNRPFLRACHGYGLECMYSKEYEKAIYLFNESLNFNKNDNQGLSPLVLRCYFLQNDLKSARKIINKYPYPSVIDFAFGSVVIEILAGNINKAKSKLPVAVKANKFFVDEVIKNKHRPPPPYRIPGEPYFDAGIPIGSIQEAYDYWSKNKVLYENKKVVEFFKKCVVEKLPK